MLDDHSAPDRAVFGLVRNDTPVSTTYRWKILRVSSALISRKIKESEDPEVPSSTSSLEYHPLAQP